MKKASLALCVFLLFGSAHGQTQEPRSSDGGTRQQQIDKLEKELRRLKRLEQIESLEKSQKENAEKLERLKKELDSGDTGASTPNPQGAGGQTNDDDDEIDEEIRTGGGTTKPEDKGTGKNNQSGSGATTGEVTPSEAAAMKGPTHRDLIKNVPRPLPIKALGYVDPYNAALFDAKYAEKLIRMAIENGALKDSDQNAPSPNFASDKGFHCIVHVVRWKDPEGAAEQTVDKQNWYVYNNGRAKGFSRTWSQEDFATENRIFGVSKVWLLYVHLNKLTTRNYLARYEFDITKKTPANLENLFAVAGLFKTLRGEATAAPFEDIWGGGAVDIRYVPSNVTVTAKFVPLREVDVAALRNRETGELDQRALDTIEQATRNVEPKVLDKPKVFDNEGLYWWDVSVGVPIRRISQLEFQNTGNTVTAKEVNKQNIFALLNLYPYPVDVKRQAFTWIPHFVGGVAIAKQPQNQILLGAGFGPRFANFYFGGLLVKEQQTTTLKEGDMATDDALAADVKKRYKAKFTFGLNLPVRGIIESFKTKKE